MLHVDLGGSEYQIAHYIKDICAAIGQVKSVKVHRSPVAFALIEMTRREHTYEVASRFGGSTFGNCALIHLGQVGHARPGRQRAAA